MKKGLTWIGERTSQIRYSDNAQNEQWIQQTSTYIPLVKIKRGQPVSIATVDDLKRVAGEDNKLFNALKNSSDTYIVLTNPSRHESSVGLALEYTEGGASLQEDTLKVANKIHILGQGQYIEDKDYYAQAFTEDETVDVSDKEYWPEFFNDYESSIGKKVYVKSNTDGELTLLKDDAYLAYNNIIIIGFVSDANIKDGNNTNNVGAIEVQLQGDDRGALDSTMFEAVIGEDVYIGKNVVQTNGETNSNTKVFALGNDEDEIFEFSFNFFTDYTKKLPKGFIALQRIDGATAYICINGEFTEQDVIDNYNELSNLWTAEDRAFVQVARYWSLNSEKKNVFVGEKEYNAEKTVIAPVGLDSYINKAFAAISAGERVSLKDGQTHNANALLRQDSPKGVYHYKANDVGGEYEVYISYSLRDYVNCLNTVSHGANYNKGYAVLADIRDKNRQNIIGIYNFGRTGLIKQGSRAIFLSKGLFKDDTSPYEVGATYYLGSHGNIFKVPQEFYNSVVQIGFAQTEDTLIVNTADPRQYNNGDLPVGYMKPSIKGEAEFGFWLMDGKTPHKIVDAPLLLERLKGFYDEKELQIKSYKFGEGDNAEGFIIPSVEYHSHYSEDNKTGYVAAQIKWLAEGVYKELPRMPFVRRSVKISNYEKDGKTYERAIIPDIDITPLMIYGPDENIIQVPDLENLDIKFFVDIDKNSESRNWVQLEPGFHTSNNFTYYGFKWTVIQDRNVDKSHPYGTFALRAVYSGTENEKTENVDTNVLGICMQADPFAPLVSLAGYDAKVFVTKHDYYSRQFDVEALFKDYVKESVVDVADNPWESNAVSGRAVRNDIKLKVDTDNLIISNDDNKTGTVEAYVKKIYLTSSQQLTENKSERDLYFNNRLLKTDLRLQNPNDNDDWKLDYYNGILEYFTSKDVLDSSIESRIRNRSKALLPFFIFQKHEDAMVADRTLLENLNATDKVEYPHGIKNDGYRGTINARQLQGAFLGYGEYVFSQNADDTANSEDTGTNVGSVNITVPYTQKYDNQYITRLGNVIKHYHGVNTLETSKLTYDAGDKVLTRKHTFSPDVLSYRENYGGITIKSDIRNNQFEFLVGDSDSTYAQVKALSITPSKIAYKYLLHSYMNKNADTTFITDYSSKDKRDSYAETMNEALQAIFEMPLATFQYNRRYEDEKNGIYYKRFFGIVVEQTANTSKKFADYDAENPINNKTTLDELNYVYTENEAKSISEYLNIITDDNDSGLNTNNAVGILLKAAQETQQRLLNLEVSTFGKDSPTLPGNDEVNNKYSENQKSTIAGLNRLVKALCREVFQDADPTSINNKGAWSDGSENYSRLDMLDKQVNGEKAKDDENKTERISLNAVNTYPKDASVTQQVNITNDYVVDADKDNDFDSAQQFINSVSYTNVDSTSEDFDGLNDAVNRIVAKLNQLTTDVKGTDEIKNRPLKLDYIRQTLETLIREIYDDSDATSEKLEGGAYKKSKVSRIDRIIQELYNFDLDVGPTKLGKTSVYNNKQLKGNKEGVEEDTTTYQIFKAISPESLEELKDTASIIDVIIELLTGDEKQLTRTDAVAWKDRNITPTGYKEKTAADGDAAAGVTYDPDKENCFVNNKQLFNNSTIISRLDVIEKALQLLSLKVANQLDFRNLSIRRNSSPYDNVTSIDDYFNYVANLFGITFEKDGFYNTERKQNIKAESIKVISNGKEHKQTSLDLYNIIYDAVKRIKNNEWALKYNDVTLGTDYDSYAQTSYDKNHYENLEETTPAYSKDYTITSDMKAVLKLLYGEDIRIDTSEEDANGTAYGHFKTADEKGDNFTKSPLTNGVSVLDCLFTQLYNVPQVRTNDASSVLTNNNNRGYADMTAYSALLYDPMVPRATVASIDTNPTLLGRGRRSKFVAKEGDAPLSRIDILENEMKAVYNYVGFGAPNSKEYYSGQFTFADTNQTVPSELWGGINENQGASVEINKKDYSIHSRYHEIEAVKSGNYYISGIALQAYYNTLDLASMLIGTDPDNTRSIKPITNAANEASEINIQHNKYEYGADDKNKVLPVINSSYSSFNIINSLQKAFDYSIRLDNNLKAFKVEAIPQIDKALYNVEELWKILGNRYSIGSTTVSSDIEELRTGQKTNHNQLTMLNTTVSTYSNAIEQIKILQQEQEKIKNSILNVDDSSASIQNENNDAAFVSLSPSTTIDDVNDADNSIVLATKNSVESLVAKAIDSLQKGYKIAIDNSTKLAALMAYMKCDTILAYSNGIEFIRSATTSYNRYTMQPDKLVFLYNNKEETDISNENIPGAIFKGDTQMLCGENFVRIEFYDFVDHVKFDVLVPYINGATLNTGYGCYENQSFKYGSGNFATSLDNYVKTVEIM